MSVSLQHIHLVSEDKYRLASWYEDNLGFKIVADIEKLGEVDGPLFISGDDGKSALSIFNKKERHKSTGTNCIPAFSLRLEDFIKLYQNHQSTNLGLKIYDHHVFISFYILDGDQNRLEITNLQVDELRAKLDELGIPYFKENPASS